MRLLQRVGFSTVVAVAASLAITSCSISGGTSSDRSIVSHSPGTSKAPDSPAFSISDDELSSAFLTQTEMAAAAGHALNFSQGTPEVSRDVLFTPASEVPKASHACVDTLTRLYTAQSHGAKGTITATDGDGHPFRLELDGLDSTTIQRVYVSGYESLAKDCTEAFPSGRIQPSRSRSPGGVGFSFQMKNRAGESVPTFATAAGYGNVLIIAGGPTQDVADRIVNAERKHLDSLITSR